MGARAPQGDAEKAAVAATGGDAADRDPGLRGDRCRVRGPAGRGRCRGRDRGSRRGRDRDRGRRPRPPTEIKPLAAEAEAPAEAEFGADSAPPEDGSAPEGFEIKGNKDSMKFHAPTSPWYDRTNAEVWFRTAEAAEAAGFVNAEQKKD